MRQEGRATQKRGVFTLCDKVENFRFCSVLLNLSLTVDRNFGFSFLFGFLIAWDFFAIEQINLLHHFWLASGCATTFDASLSLVHFYENQKL